MQTRWAAALMGKYARKRSVCGRALQRRRSADYGVGCFSSQSTLHDDRPIDIVGIALTCRGVVMSNIVLRNLEDHLEEKLRLRAASNNRSVSAELREIVRASLSQQRHSNPAELKRLAADIRALSEARGQTPSETLLRESRDSQ